MLTVEFDRLGVRAGDRVLDLGCGGGRHAFELYRRGAHVVALDRDDTELKGAGAVLEAMHEAGEAPAGASAALVHGDALGLPFGDGTFDHVVAAEVLEHIPDDRAAMSELARVLRPGGTMAVTVPRWLPELVCWALASDYHDTPGGHVRIYRHSELCRRLEGVGLEPYGSHHAHGLHAPYWWLRCLFGVDADPEGGAALPVRLYHRLLVWDIARRPIATRAAERVLAPLIGKSLVVYLRKPEVA